jgi:hypothetical protein
MYVFGGCGEGGGASNDFFQLETDTWTWCVAAQAQVFVSCCMLASSQLMWAWRC